MADDKELEITEENTRPDGEQPIEGTDTSPALPAEGQAPDFSGPGATGTVGSPVDLASPDAAPAEGEAPNGAIAGDVASLEEAAPAADQGTLSLPPTGETSAAEPASASPALPAEASQEASASGALSPTLPGDPADLAGAPSAGKPIDATPATVPTDAGYPVPKEDANEPPIHPTTLQPMVNDGLGEDKGKVAEASASAGVTGDRAAEAPAEAPVPASAPVDVDGAEGNNLQEVEDAVNALGARFDAIDSKLEGLSASLKKILHKL